MMRIPGTAAELPRYWYWCSEIPPTELSGDTNELCPPVTLPLAPADMQMLLSVIVADDSADCELTGLGYCTVPQSVVMST